MRKSVPGGQKVVSIVLVRVVVAHSSYSEGDHCPLRLGGLPAAHTFF